MTPPKAARINARLPADVARKVAYLERRTKMSATQIVVTSIERYYDAVTQVAGTPADALAEAGFIGCAEGPVDLSSSYKSEMGRSLAKKA